jgi:hypothetical protein
MILSAAASGDTALAPDNTLGAPAPGYKKTIVPRTLGHLSRRQRRRFRGEISLWHERVIISVVMSGWSWFSPRFDRVSTLQPSIDALRVTSGHAL